MEEEIRFVGGVLSGHSVPPEFHPANYVEAIPDGQSFLKKEMEPIQLRRGTKNDVYRHVVRKHGDREITAWLLISLPESYLDHSV